MKTNKQNKKPKNIGSTNIVSETQNRTDQLSRENTATTTATPTATAPAPEPAPVNNSLSAGGEGQGEVVQNSSDPRPSTLAPLTSIRPYVNFSERDFNRKLSVEKVLEKLQRWMPKQFELAEVVGKWIWITFSEPPAETVRADLSQLGFHWNNTRKCWQHPCGETLPRGQQEPRDKYEVWFPRATETLRRKKAHAQKSEVYFDSAQAASVATALLVALPFLPT